MSTRPQLEELSLLLTRLQRHQAKLASVRNFAVGQLLHHYLTFPACQVSAGGLSWAQTGMACHSCFPVQCALVCPAGWLSPSSLACLLLGAISQSLWAMVERPPPLALPQGRGCMGWDRPEPCFLSCAVARLAHGHLV